MKKLLISIRNVLPALVVLAFLFPACSKNNSAYVTPTGNSFLAVTNASASPNTYSAFVDSANVTSTALGFGSTTGNTNSPYLAVPAGQHVIRLSSNGTTNAIDTNINFMTGVYYSVFAYDTAVGSGTLKTLILADNLLAPGTGQAELRFLALSPNANATNVTLINGTDTVTFKNAGYIGSTSYNPDSLAAYTVINPGTYHVAINNVDNINMLNADSVTVLSGKIYTIYSKGYTGITGANALSVGVIQQN